MPYIKTAYSGDQIRSGTVVSYLNLSLDLVVGILLIPFILDRLGQAEYGLYSLMGSLVAYLVILDLGLNNTIVRYVAKYRAEQDREGEACFLGLCLAVYGFLAAVVVVMGVILLFNLDVIFGRSLTGDEIAKGRLLLAILTANVALSLPLNSFQAILIGYERFVFQRSLILLRTVLRPIILFFLLTTGHKSLAIVVLDTVLNLAILFGFMGYALIILKVRIKLHSFDRLLLKEIFGFTFFVFLAAIVEQVYWRLGQVILGATANTATVAVFSVGMLLATYYMAFSGAMAGLFLPKATQMVVGGASGETLTDLLIRVGRIQFIILAYILVGFILLGKQFILIWAGPDYEKAWLIALSMMIPLMVPLCQTTASSILLAKKLHRFRAVVYLVIAIASAVISLILTRYVGIWGPAIGTAVCLFLGSNVVVNLYYHFRVGLNIPRFFKELSRGLLPVIAVTLIVGVATLRIPGMSLQILIIQGVLVSLCYWTMMWKLGMNTNERRLILGLLGRLSPRVSAESPPCQ